MQITTYLKKKYILVKSRNEGKFYVALTMLGPGKRAFAKASYAVDHAKRFDRKYKSMLVACAAAKAKEVSQLSEDG
jgi:hypothetical protein